MMALACNPSMPKRWLVRWFFAALCALGWTVFLGLHAAQAQTPVPNHASIEALSLFLQQAKSGRSQFTQVVSAPAHSGQPVRVKTSSGVFEFQRPGQFRFNYQKPFVQTIVADGQTVWLYDADLNQVTARKQAQVISATPAALISAAPDLQVLKKEFALQGEPDADGLKWLRATPLQADSAIKTVRMAFQNSPALTLAVLEIHDSLGQTSRIQFARFELNPTLPSDSFQFKTPPGAQVLWP